jgi:hypothetical protein
MTSTTAGLLRSGRAAASTSRTPFLPAARPHRIPPIVAKRRLQIAAFPGNRIGAVFVRLSALFPQAVAALNILHTRFTNVMLHVANRVANAARIERGDGYKFYAAEVMPAVARLCEAISAERVLTGTPTPAVDALIETVSHMTGTNDAIKGRTPDCPGFGGMDGAQIRRAVEVEVG